MLDDLAAILGGHRASAALVDALGARRRELDGPLRVVVLGEFSAGKSTFLNALAGAEVSPMGVLPTTAHVHVLRHGAPGARVLDRRGDVVETSVEECARAVARRRDAGVEIDRVEVTLPLPALARLELVDTPGFNSGDPAHDDAARRAVALADVALWLFDARQAGRHSEAEAIAAVAAAGAPVVGVLNKVDQVPEGERGAVLRVLAEGLGERAPVVAAVSARAALAAMRAGGPVGDAAPGWAALLAWLDAGLVDARDAGSRPASPAAPARSSTRPAPPARPAPPSGASGSPPRARSATPSGPCARRSRARARRCAARWRPPCATSSARSPRAAATTATRSPPTPSRRRAGARERCLAGCARVAEVERLGVAAGLAPDDAPELLTAPLVQWLDHAAASGARDAAARAPRGRRRARGRPPRVARGRRRPRRARGRRPRRRARRRARHRARRARTLRAARAANKRHRRGDEFLMQTRRRPR
ncbi:MAG: dynamin family protein [Polyangiales bacterium]